MVKVEIDGDREGVEFHLFDAPITELAAGERFLLVEDVHAFEFRYGSGLPVAGQWSGGLGNGGETVALIAGNAVVHQFAYDDAWYPQTDGGGFSLKVIDPTNHTQDSLAQMTSWQPSPAVGGTPGSTASSMGGDFNGDQQVNAADIDLLYSEVNRMTHDPLFELIGDGRVDQHDVNELVQNMLGTIYGDTNLDGDVDSADFNTLSNHWGQPGGWGQADFDGNSAIVFGDFVFLTNNFGARVCDAEHRLAERRC